MKEPSHVKQFELFKYVQLGIKEPQKCIQSITNYTIKYNVKQVKVFSLEIKDNLINY